MKFLKSLLFSIFGIFFSLSSMEFPYHPTKEVTLISGLQFNEHPVTTSSPEAQKYFNQGLTLVYGFNHDEAYWSFQKAVALDPDFAMGYWGMALALGPNINMGISGESEMVAFQHIQKAIELSKNITQNEKDYIQALSKRYTDSKNPDRKKLTLDYRDAMKALSAKYPDDPDAAVLYAESILDVSPWKQWTPSGDPAPGTLEIVDVLESVLKRVPDHLGANHYFIHAIEASKHPEYALINAERLYKLAPPLGHLMHMPSHIFILVGDYHRAALANDAAIATELSYIRQYGIGGIYPVHYLSHNYYFLLRALNMEGNYKRALQAADEFLAFYLPHYQEMPDLEYYLSGKLAVYLHFNKWQDLLKMAKIDAKADIPITDALWHFGRGLAYAALGDKASALKEKQAFEQIKAKVPESAQFGYNSVKPIFQIAENLLNAKLARLDNDPTKEVDLLKEAVHIQDTLSYNEPPDWFFPVRETLGAALLKNGRYAEAEQVFREDLNLHPRNGRSLFGLLQSLKSQNRTTGSFFVQQQFDDAWQFSDTPLTLDNL